MKKRIISAVMALVCLGMLSSCSLLPHSGSFRDNSDHIASVQMQNIAHAVRSQSAAELKKLFSATAQAKATDLDDGVKYFLSAFPSGRTRWKGGAGLTGSTEFSKRATELYGNYEVSANGDKYSVYFAYFSVNDFHPDEVGIYALGVVPKADDGYTESGAKKPFNSWASQFGIDEKTDIATGDPGVYVPKT